VSGERFYEGATDGFRRSAPAALRNREPIVAVLREWLPSAGLVLEIASGTGEHVVHFARTFPQLDWQPSDVHADALASIVAWANEVKLPNLRPPLMLDAAAPDWPIGRADAVLSINMVHISAWPASLGLLGGAARLLGQRAPLILYGAWLEAGVEPAPSNLAFDADLRARNAEWGLRLVEDFASVARERGWAIEQRRSMPANNLMLLLRRRA